MSEIFLFGPPRFERKGEPIHISRRKSVALAAYLACTGQPVARETLAALLWPEHDQSAALKGLRRELARLKQALGPESVRATRTHLALNERARVTVDVVTFHQELQLVQEHNHFPAGACRRCLEALEAAVDLYSAPFMAGFNLLDCPEFDAWQSFQRESARQGAGRSLQRLAIWHLSQQQPERALQHARRWLALDPLHEAARRALMEIYAASGQPAAALRIYEEGVTLLQAELGVEPEAETSRLAASIRDGAARPVRQRGCNLPAQTTPFVGRARELTMIALRLQEVGCRLLTVVGPTGIGKTRLVLEAGRLLAESRSPFADGIHFVPLAEVEDVGAMTAALMAAVNLPPAGSAPSAAQLLDGLGERNLLLILDNLEHLPEAGALISRILARAPNVKILATSCTALRLREEWAHPLHGLSVPPAGAGEEPETATTYDAVRLFEQRARQVSPTFSLEAELAHVVRICRLLEGIPLALELATAWIDVLDAQTIAAELEDGLELLQARVCNLPPRQQSMEAGLRQTWSLLDRVEREALARLAIFQDAFTREEAARIGGATLPVLTGLVEKSLLHRVGPGHFRLPQPFRHFAGKEFEVSAC